MVTVPLIIILEAEVNETDVPDPILLVKFPSIVKAVPGMVLVTAPDELLNIKLP